MNFDFELLFQDFLDKHSQKSPDEAREYFEEFEEYFKDEIYQIDKSFEKKELSV